MVRFSLLSATAALLIAAALVASVTSYPSVSVGVSDIPSALSTIQSAGSGGAIQGPNGSGGSATLVRRGSDDDDQPEDARDTPSEATRDQDTKKAEDLAAKMVIDYELLECISNREIHGMAFSGRNNWTRCAGPYVVICQSDTWKYNSTCPPSQPCISTGDIYTEIGAYCGAK